MKNILKLFGIITLICFSFFYTEKVITVISNEDPLKMEIMSLADSYKISPNEAIITSDTIIPGNKGREVNIEKSYKKMRKTNVFNDNLLVYDILHPEHILVNNLDKYIIRGNINKKEISVLFIVTSNNNLARIINILDNKNITGNLFIEYKYLNSNISNIRNYAKHNIYSYQEEYSYDTLIISNNIIKRIANNEPVFCLTKEKNKDNLNVCTYTNMNTIIPSINGNLNNIKLKLENGSIILFDTSINTVNELAYIIEFITGKGYSIVGLDKLLDES